MGLKGNGADVADHFEIKDHATLAFKEEVTAIIFQECNAEELTTSWRVPSFDLIHAILTRCHDHLRPWFVINVEEIHATAKRKKRTDLLQVKIHPFFQSNHPRIKNITIAGKMSMSALEEISTIVEGDTTSRHILSLLFQAVWKSALVHFTGHTDSSFLKPNYMFYTLNKMLMTHAYGTLMPPNTTSAVHLKDNCPTQTQVMLYEMCTFAACFRHVTK
jgi:hypothetical protein